MAQAIETIRNRIDQLGVSEPVIQEHGLGSIRFWCSCPGVDDPARVKEIMQSTAMLEIKQVLGGPYPSEQDALQQHNGVLPAGFDAASLTQASATGRATKRRAVVPGVAQFRGSGSRSASAAPAWAAIEDRLSPTWAST